MRKLLLALILIIAGTITGQPNSKNYLVPSFYSTVGNYNNGNSSISYSGFLLFTVESVNHVIVGYDYQTISVPSLDYNQQMFVVGEYLNFDPWIISGHFAYVGGGYKSGGHTSLESEFMNIYNINCKYSFDLFNIGTTYTFTNIRGTNTLSAHQAGITFDYFLNNYFSFHINTFYSHINDGRDLKSGTLILDVSPSKSLLLTAHRTLGKRAYFFDPDQLIPFNQFETLQGSYGLKTVLSLVGELELIFSYDKYDFNEYMVDYFSGGVRFNIPI